MSRDGKVILVPWVGPASYRKALSVFVLSSDVEIISRVSEALIEMHDKGDFSWKLLVFKSLNLEDITKSTRLTGNLAIDFIIIALDTSKVFCLAWAEKIIEQIHPDLRKRRTVLVNTSGLPAYGMAVSASDLISYSVKCNLDLLSANVFRLEDASLLARKLIKYLEVTVGVKTGIPNLHI